MNFDFDGTYQGPTEEEAEARDEWLEMTPEQRGDAMMADLCDRMEELNAVRRAYAAQKEQPWKRKAS